jgi:hypothetical protein
MDARSLQKTSLPLVWPLAGSLLLTAVTVALVCERPPAGLHSWGQVFSLATLYLLAAGSVHALAVWGVCRIREESETAKWPMVWQAIWVAWIAIVWLPLIALLTSEHSFWVAAVLPVTAIFAALLLRNRSPLPVEHEAFAARAAETRLFCAEEAAPLWRALLPAIFTAAAVQMGIALLATGHAWPAGCLIGAGAIYPVERLIGVSSGRAVGRSSGRTSAGNSVVVWMMLVLALVPLLARYATSTLGTVLGLRAPAPPRIARSSPSENSSHGYTGVILLMPRKPRTVVLPQPETTVSVNSLRRPREIPFDGAYWYFKEPDTRPGSTAKIMHGDPAHKRLRSTDDDPIMMEAHQPLGKPVSMSCCGALRVNVINADNVPGSIGLEVLLRDTVSRKITAVSLGTVVLASSKVSPMPLTRPPVEESVTFPLTRVLSQAERHKSFDEITVRIKPERSRSLAGAQVAIKSFMLEP